MGAGRRALSGGGTGQTPSGDSSEHLPPTGIMGPEGSHIHVAQAVRDVNWELGLRWSGAHHHMALSEPKLL